MNYARLGYHKVQDSKYRCERAHVLCALGVYMKVTVVIFTESKLKISKISHHPICTDRNVTINCGRSRSDVPPITQSFYTYWNFIF